MMTHC